MLDLLKLTQNYFIAFSNKDLDELDKLYSDHVTLNEWNQNVTVGKKEVLDSNRMLFECDSLTIEVVSQGVDQDEHNRCTLNRIVVWIDGKSIDIVDVIYFNSDGLIEEIRAFKGF